MTSRFEALAIIVLVFAGHPLNVAHGQDEDGGGEDTTQSTSARDEARRVLAEARAHEEAQRYALAAESYRRMHDIMQRAALERAAIALYWAGRALSHVPGREREARDTFQSFLDSSTLLTEDAEVRDWRSNALERIAELNARIGPDALEEPPADAEHPDVSAETTTTPQTRRLSPIGPILLGVGGGTLVAGGIAGAVLLADNDALVARCLDGTCPTAAREQAEAVQMLGLATDILLITGTLIAAAGLVLTFVLYEGDDPDDAQQVAAYPACDTEGCSIIMSGRF